jgi:dihydrodipicolinate synthase/N-acetylneuraminate lyase
MSNVKGMKASTTNAHYIFNTTWALKDKDDFAFISGAESAFLTGLVTGSKAVIGQGATINPKILSAIQTRYEANDLAGAIEAQRSTNLLCEECENPVEFFKRYATESGFPVQSYRRGTGKDAYGIGDVTLSQEEYDTFKTLLESESAKFA